MVGRYFEIVLNIYIYIYMCVCNLLNGGHYATSRKVTGSIPDEVNLIFQLT
jgi:hypothetical protein